MSRTKYPTDSQLTFDATIWLYWRAGSKLGINREALCIQRNYRKFMAVTRILHTYPGQNSFLSKIKASIM